MSNKTTKVQLSLRASKLHNVAGTFKGKSDPYAIVTVLSSDAQSQAEVLGKTETIKNSLNPSWIKVFFLDYTLGIPTHINVGIYDEIRKVTDKPMGSATFELGEIIGSVGNVRAKKLKDGGTLYARVIKAPMQSSGKLELKMSGLKLKNVEGFFGKSDPFFELSRTDEGPGGATWRPVLRSKHISDNLNPNWEQVSIDLNILCDGNEDRPIRISVFDHESSGNHKSMGTLETTINKLIEARSQGARIPLHKKSKTTGHILVKEANISASGQPQFQAQTGISTPILAPPTVQQSQPILAPPTVQQSQPILAPPTVQQSQPILAPPSVQQSQPILVAPSVQQSQPTFVDYISGGCELKAYFAIDFTGSNGDPRVPGTLHHIQPHGLNDYEKAITAVGEIVAKYDSDQKFPVWGFGAKFGGIVRHCFQVGPLPEVDGIGGVLEAYRGMFSQPMIMSGPTYFHEVISTAASLATNSQENASRFGKQSYTVLILLTDGAVTDVNQAKMAIETARNAPLSIVIIGVGSADFSSMQFLDDFSKGPNRDITQFVEFRAHQHDKNSLTNATLEEIPRQLVEFFRARNIMPLPLKNENEITITPQEHNESTDIDLKLKVDPEGDIVICGNSGICFDNTYDSGMKYLGTQVLPPPK